MFNSKTERLIFLLPWLVANPGMSLEDIAIKFNSSKKEILRDIELLTLTGPGEYGGDLVDIYYDSNFINVRDPQGLTAPVKLAKNESLLISMVLFSLMNVLSQDLSQAATRLINSLMEDEVILESEATDNPNHSSVISLLNSFIEAQKVIEFEYLSANDFYQKTRKISPWKLSIYNNNTYLIGYCHDSKKEKIFRVSGIVDMKHSENSSYKEPFEFNKIENTTYKIQALAHPHVLDALNRFPNFQVIRAKGNVNVVSFEVFSLEYCMRLALEYRGSVQIIDPPNIEIEVNSIINGFLS